ncbi:MAG: winged helix-turn-helix domain-containing protein [Vibrio toranzoniae]|uniref:winged helix-turn-helix domain-containing protein n=1 Tax=Vibrio toranzoniae TaxID=1194427 RepID=UPI003F966A82
MTDILKEAKESSSCIQLANLIYNPTTKILSFDGRDIDLEPRARELLELFLSNIDKPISNNEIIEIIWHNKFTSRNVVTNKVGYLRTLLKEYLKDVEPTKLIVTYPKKGYYIPSNFVSLISVQCGKGLQFDDSKELQSKFVKSNKICENKDIINYGKYKVFYILSALFVAIFIYKLLGGYEQYNNTHDMRVESSSFILLKPRFC